LPGGVRVIEQKHAVALLAGKLFREPVFGDQQRSLKNGEAHRQLADQLDLK